MSEDWKDILKGLQGSRSEEEPEDYRESAEDSSREDKDIRKGKLNIMYERKGRGGKSVTIIYGFPEDFPEEEIEQIGRNLKQRIGVGGSSRGGEILLQGDVRQKASELLRAEGWRIKG